MTITLSGTTQEGSGLLTQLGTVPVSRLTAHELVQTTLRRGILTGAIPGGTRLVQADIAAQLRVSTTPVREALRDLATEGLIRLDSHRGAVVRIIDLGEARDIYELRLLLEPMAMGKAAAHITEDELRQAEELHEQMTGSVENADWVELNRRFHQLLTGASRGMRLPGLVSGLQDSAAMYVGAMIESAPVLRAKADVEHRRMLQALRDRDADAAAKAIHTHLSNTVEALLATPASRD